MPAIRSKRNLKPSNAKQNIKGKTKAMQTREGKVDQGLPSLHASSALCGYLKEVVYMRTLSCQF